MSVRIQPQQAAIAATEPVDAVPLSERVQARLPQRHPSAPDEATLLPASPPAVPQHDAEALAQLDTLLAGGLVPDPSQLALQGVTASLHRMRPTAHPGANTSAAGTHARAAKANAASVAASVAAAVSSQAAAATSGTNAVALPADASALVKGAMPGRPGADPATVSPASSNGTTPAPTAGVAAAIADSAASAAALASKSGGSASPQAAPHVAMPRAQDATAHATPATDGDAAPPIELPPSTTHRAGSTETITAMPSAPAQPTGSDTNTEGQSSADARRAEANLGTRQHVRAARQAEALQTAMASRVEAGSQIHVAFNSWGAGHAVSARMEGGRLHMQASSARVGDALSSTEGPAGTELLIAVESSDTATDERQRRRRHQGAA